MPSGGGEVVQRISLAGGLDQGLELRGAPIGQEDGAGLGSGGQDVAGAVILLGLAGLLVLLDQVLVILVHRKGAGDSGLDVVAHLKAIDVQRWLLIQDQDPLAPKAGEVLSRLAVHRRVVGVDAFGQVDLGARHVQEAHGLAFSQGGGFAPIHHVVGDGGHVGDMLGVGAQGAEGT